MTGLHLRALQLAGRFGPADVDLALGTVSFVIGPNGAGKTSLFHALIGHGEVSGTLKLGEIDLADLPPAVRMRHISFMPASRDIAWPMRARDVVALGLAPGLAPNLIDQVLTRLDAVELGARPINSLSTGERTRILIARALVSQPDVILLDEPLANLDPAWRLRVLALLEEEAQRGAIVLLSVHDLILAHHHHGDVLLVDQGKLIGQGRPDVIMGDAPLSAIFGVRLTDRGMELADSNGGAA
ncbi:ABC transporter ATP-binding protein [Aquisediminimonas sediminicola]|uniref:ABC transporter ATP-binding protein n=1 Tax=Alteraquisediminimonas sediminicola TaxID=2676787 RepID=UPI001C8D6A75|nr:ABC transporter ATP-binding protein [Aquisediminimonas sediminicola]